MVLAPLLQAVFFGTLNWQGHGSSFYVNEHNRFGLDLTHYSHGTSGHKLLFTAGTEDLANILGPDGKVSVPVICTSQNAKMNIYMPPYSHRAKLMVRASFENLQFLKEGDEPSLPFERWSGATKDMDEILLQERKWQ